MCPDHGTLIIVIKSGTIERCALIKPPLLILPRVARLSIASTGSLINFGGVRQTARHSRALVHAPRATRELVFWQIGTWGPVLYTCLPITRTADGTPSRSADDRFRSPRLTWLLQEEDNKIWRSSISILETCNK